MAMTTDIAALVAELRPYADKTLGSIRICVTEVRKIVDALEALQSLQAERDEARKEISRLTGRQEIAIVDQDGTAIGKAYKNHAELLREEAFVDDNGTAWTVPTAWAYRQTCIALTAAQETIRRQREALEEAEPILAQLELPSGVDPNWTEAVWRLGNAMGFGALMHTASAQWRELLNEQGGAGGEFVVGPCAATARNAWHRLRAALEPAGGGR